MRLPQTLEVLLLRRYTPAPPPEPPGPPPARERGRGDVIRDHTLNYNLTAQSKNWSALEGADLINHSNTLTWQPLTILLILFCYRHRYTKLSLHAHLKGHWDSIWTQHNSFPSIIIRGQTEAITTVVVVVGELRGDYRGQLPLLLHCKLTGVYS